MFRLAATVGIVFLAAIIRVDAGVAAECDGSDEPETVERPLRFAAPQIFAASGTSSLTTGDIDGDGRPDIAPAVFSTGARWFRNLGDGSFSATRTLSGSPPTNGSHAFVDLDGDGDDDLVVRPLQPPQPGQRIQLLRNEGGGRFEALPSLEFSERLEAVRHTDIDGDGLVDFVLVLRDSADRLVIVWGDDPSQIDELDTLDPVARQGRWALEEADLDGDGDVDLIASTGREMLFFAQGPERRFSRSALGIPLGSERRLLAVDLDGDALTDIAIADADASKPFGPWPLRILFNRGGGTFDEPVSVAARGEIIGVHALERGRSAGSSLLLRIRSSGPQLLRWSGRDQPPDILDIDWTGSVAIADFDGDGFDDVLLRRLQPFNSGSRLTLAAVVPGNRIDDLSDLATRPSLFGAPSSFAGDADANGRADVVLVPTQGDSVSLLTMDGGSVSTVTAAVPSPASARPVDIDGDGDLDVVAVSTSWRNVSILRRRGPESLVTEPATAIAGPPRAWTLGDFDGDGRLDFATTLSSSAEVAVLLQRDGTFGPEARITSRPNPAAIVAVDLDKDGTTDLVTTNGPWISHFPGRGDGSFGRRHDFSAGARMVALAAGEIDDAPGAELVAMDKRGNVRLFRDRGTGLFRSELVIGSEPWTPDTETLLLHDADGDGDVDLFLFGSSWFGISFNDGSGRFSRPARHVIPGGAIGVADLDADTHADVVFVSSSPDPPGLGHIVALPGFPGLPDCDGNGVHDTCELPAGDCNANDVLDACEPDSDGDGRIDACDVCPGADDLVDRDGDGAPDCRDTCPETADPAQADRDGDGIGDACDTCPDDPLKSVPGTCGCGVADVDSDRDQVPDCLDGCPRDSYRVQPDICPCNSSGGPDDTDGDGIIDCLDNCYRIPNPDQSNRDGDHAGDACEECPDDLAKTSPGQCGCGITEVDADEDRVADCIDGCPANPQKAAPGLCGCDSSDFDLDGDGTPDCLDACRTDRNKIAPGRCGCRVPDFSPLGEPLPCPTAPPTPTPRTAPATFRVDSTFDRPDTNPGDGICRADIGRCTLRAAVQEANRLIGPDRIELPADATVRIQLRGFEDDGVAGDLDVVGELEIVGAAGGGSIITGGSVDSVFHVHAGAHLRLEGLTVADGSSNCIVNFGRLTANDVVIRNCPDAGVRSRFTAVLELNHTTILDSAKALYVEGTLEAYALTVRRAETAAIENHGTAVIRDSDFDGNRGFLWNRGRLELSGTRVANGGGAGIRNDGTIGINSSVIENSSGSGLLNHEDLTMATTSVVASGGSGLVNASGAIASVEASSFVDNGNGGVRNEGTLTLVNTTIAENDGDDGAGFLNTGGTASLNNVTLVANTATAGAGLTNRAGTVVVANSIIADNQSTDARNQDCSGTLLVLGPNLIGSPGRCRFDGDPETLLSGVDPGLAALRRLANGTLIAPLRSSSPAVGSGSDLAPSSGIPGACAGADQSGAPRGVIDRCDLGALEYAEAVLTPTRMPTVTRTPTPTATPTHAPRIPCPGDCNGDGSVAVDEIVTLLTIALGNAAPSGCTAGDPDGNGVVTVDEILRALSNAMAGCPNLQGASG